jgi:hypothetical protein
MILKITIELNSIEEAQVFGLMPAQAIGAVPARAHTEAVERLLELSERIVESVPPDLEPVVYDLGQPAPEAPEAAEPQPEKPKNKVGRPRKTQTEAPAPEPPKEEEKTPLEAAIEHADAALAVPPPNGEFEVALAELEAQMKTAGQDADKIASTMTEWRVKGPEAVALLKSVVEKNKEFLAKKSAPAPAPAPAAPSAPSDKPPTEDQLRSAGMDFMASHDMPQLLNLLSNYGCNRVAEMAQKPVAQQWEFISKCKGTANA